MYSCADIFQGFRRKTGNIGFGFASKNCSTSEIISTGSFSSKCFFYVMGACTNDEVMSLGDLPANIKAFGFDLYEINGHDLDAIEAALAAPHTPGVPECILGHTVKGKGVSFMENQVGWHGKAPNAEQREQALKELEG